jgi:hypothetical protein
VLRIVVTLLAFAGSFAAAAVVAFFAVLTLAGPHGGLLPRTLHGATLAIGWLIVLALPTWVATWTWRRVGRAAGRGTRHR